MPTVSSTPRSAGGYTITGGRRVAGGRTVGRRGVTTGTVRPGSPRTGEEAILGIQGATPSDRGRTPLTPLRFALRASNVPGRAIGEAIRDPRTLVDGRSAIDLFRDEKAVGIGDALRGRGVIPGGKAGIALGLAADIFLDPTTYVTFGGSAAARAAGRGIAREAADQVVSSGRRLTPAERARFSARAAAERAEAPRAVSVGLTVPFTRNRTLWLGESEALARSAGRVARAITPDRLRDTVARGLASGRGADAVVNDVYQDVRRLTSVEARDMSQAVRAGNIATRKAARQAGLSHRDATEAISDFLAGMRADLPEALRPLADDARRLLDDQDAAEVAAGIEKGHLPDYIPFLIARQEDRAAYDRIFGAATANVVDNPFFVRPRNTPDFATFKRVMRERGIEPETNIWRLIEKRGRASLRAQEKKAIDDAITAVHGVKAPAREVPEVAGVAAKLEREQTRLTELAAPLDVAGPQAAATAARQAEVDARAALRAATQTGDPVAVRAARAEVARVGDLAREQSAIPVEAMGDIPDAEALRAIAAATRRGDRRVAKAERRLRAVEKAGSKREINAARNALTQATSSRHQARLALERARAGYVGSPREVIAQVGRVQKAERKLTKVERERGAIILANERQAAREGREVTAEDFAALRGEWEEIGQATKYHQGTLLPPEVAASLDQIHRLITPTMRDEDSVLAVSRFMRNLTGRWKALALLSPGYFARNVLDDGLRAYWAGARNPASFVQATRALRGGKGTARLEGRDYTLSDLVNLAESNGVIRTGYVRTEVASSADEAVLRGRFAGPGRGPLARFSGDANELREDATRLGTFIDLMKRGDDADTAARQVRTYLFDYSEVGAFVESARRFWLPFITFTSKAIPLTAREFARRPGRAANISKVMAASEQAAGNPDMSYLPPWSESSFAVPSSAAFRRFIGAPADQPLILNPERVSGFTTLDTLDPRPDAIQRNWGGMVTPFVRAPVEAVTNYSTFKGRSYFENERVWSPWLAQRAQALGVPVPGYGPKKDTYANEFGAGYSPRLDTLLRMLPIFGQQASVIPSREGGTHLAALKYSTGLPLSPYDRLRGAYYADKAGR